MRQLKSLQDKLATAKAELKADECRKKELESKLQDLGVESFEEIPAQIKSLEKKERIVSKKLDKILEELENGLKNIEDQ